MANLRTHYILFFNDKNELAGVFTKRNSILLPSLVVFQI